MGWFDYTPIGALDSVTGNHLEDLGKRVYKKGKEAFDNSMDRDPDDLAGGLRSQADKSSAWADESRKRVSGLTRESAANRARLQDIATGRESVSAMQLKQANQQNQAMQQSMAAGARGGNSAMAARQAAMNAGRQGAGLAGQQAIAGIQERQAAQSALSQALLGERGQDVGATNAGYGNAAGAYGTALGATLGQPSSGEKWLGAAAGAAQLATLLSDKRLKKNISEGADDASKLLKSLKAYTYDYKDGEHGKGRQLGIMAQDLEESDFGHMMVEEDEDGNKRVNGPKLAAAIAATLPGINKRLEALEGDEEDEDYSELAKALSK